MSKSNIIAMSAVLLMVVSGVWAAGGSDVKLPSPDEAETMLRQGNARFITQTSKHPHQSLARLKETAEGGQHPFATVITCSDSRVPVELLFDQGFGDVFVIRVAGNVCDTDEIGSIEYGVDHLSTPILVVLGHTHCGAVTAVATGAELHGCIVPLVDNIKPALQKCEQKHPGVKGKALVPMVIEQNVWQSIEDLLKRSPASCKRAKAGTLKIVGAIYDIKTGKVRWMGEHPDQAKLIAAAEAAKAVPEKAAEKIEKPAEEEKESKVDELKEKIRDKAEEKIKDTIKEKAKEKIMDEVKGKGGGKEGADPDDVKKKLEGLKMSVSASVATPLAATGITAGLLGIAGLITLRLKKNG